MYDPDEYIEKYMRQCMPPENAVAGCLGIALGFGVALIVCAAIYIISV